MTTKRLQVQCECGARETIGSLMAKIAAGAQELQRTLDSKPIDFLAHSLFKTKVCEGCDGKGWIAVANGPDDFDKETCGGCSGKGRVLANN